MQAEKSPRSKQAREQDRAQDEALLQRFAVVDSTLTEHRKLCSAEAVLVVVTKTFPLPHVLPLLSHGHRHFGENRVQEAHEKWHGVRERYPDLCLHAIGALQSNKALQAVRLFDVIHSLDRPRLAYALAEAIAKTSTKTSRSVSCFVQVNIGSEPQKAGVNLEELESFLRCCREECALPIVGLMCLPPHGETPAPYCALLAKLAGEHGLAQLSMGMSDDYAEALAFGATHVRVGSAIMGVREKNHK